MKKIFILTGEISGDKLASKVISKLKINYPDIKYSCVGGEHLETLGIKSIFNLKEITYIGFTSVILNIFKIRRIINKTVDEIIKFNPDILFSVDSPDFTLRVSQKVKEANNKIKTIHYVAPQVWVWREGRVKKFKKFLDHILLLFKFEKKYFDKELIPSTFVGHPLLEKNDISKVDISNFVPQDKKIISLYPGSRSSEIKILLPILISFIKLMNKKFNEFFFIFHTVEVNKNLVLEQLRNENLTNVNVVNEENIKSQLLSNSFFAVSKSGTVSLEICKANVPLIIIYKMNLLNFLLVKFLVKVKYANILNIINDKEIIPELIQKNCNEKEIYKSVTHFLNHPELIEKQKKEVNRTLLEIKSDKLSSENVANVILNYL